tara:strand:- start:770 stop:991 length:222 start_codon:yes stop_codon:yes gene_type:complete
MSNTYELKEGKGSIHKNTKTDEKHQYYGSFKASRDIKQGEIIKFQGYNNVSQNNPDYKYIGLQMMDKREEDIG